MSDTGAARTSGPIFQDIGQIEPRPVDAPFRSPNGLAIAVTVAVALRTVLTLGQMVGEVMRLKVLGDARRLGPGLAATLQYQARQADAVVQASAAIGLLAIVGGFVVGGMWIYRAACNVRALGARGLETSPGWAVGFYAVPIMNWFRPLLAMSEIWRASFWPESWRSRDMPPLLGFWWAGWIGESLVGYFVYFMSKVDGGGSRMVANEVSLLQLVMELATMGLFLTIVWRVTRAQLTTRRHVQQVADTFA